MFSYLRTNVFPPQVYAIGLVMALMALAPGCRESKSIETRKSESGGAMKKKATANDAAGTDDWDEWFEARLAAMKPVLGESEDRVFHSLTPFYLGGGADIVVFRHHVDGWVYVTNDLIGDDQQIKNNFGQYELMVCHRAESDWSPPLLSNLARYTTQAALNPMDTMDIGAALPEESTISAFLFVSYGTFKVKEIPAGLLLCLGITEDELEACKAGQAKEVLQKLKDTGIFPFTDLNRSSVSLSGGTK